MLYKEIPVIREAPASRSFATQGSDPTLPNVRDGVDPNNREPVLHSDNIQGNILGGFNKDHQLMLYLDINEVPPFKRWLAAQVPFVSTTAEVIAFNRLFKDLRLRRRREGYLKSTWMNMAFSYEGLLKLNHEAHLFCDKSFQAGLATRSKALGDPQDERRGNPNEWLIGGFGNEADVVLIIAADDRNDMLAEVNRIEESLIGSGATILFKDEAANLPQPLAGHEHFGFLDGISQPGVRGTVSDDPTDLLTPRQNPMKPHTATSPGQGKPGQDVLWPGEFVFGYPGGRQTGEEGGFETPTVEPIDAGPRWANDGSFLVIRRLHQDVGGFHAYLKRVAEDYRITPSRSSSPARYVGSRLVGRWPSGCPILRSPHDDNFALGSDDCANNNFEFGDETEPLPEQSPGNFCAETFPNSKGDLTGAICPFSGHIRKSYPRDDESNTKTLDPDVPDCKSRILLNEDDTQKRRMLRRGIPYGTVSPSTPDSPVTDTIDRGLQFLSYQTSIQEQFEFVIACWANNPDFKEASSEGHKNTGYDPIIGQNPNGSREFDLALRDGTTTRLRTDENWVWATGGGYFFAPSIDALSNYLSK